MGGAYLLANAAAAPIWAKLSDIWGRKPMLLITVLWFLLSSIICAAAVNMTMLIVGRALQGTAGGGLMQLVMIVISDLFSVRLVTVNCFLCICLFSCSSCRTTMGVANRYPRPRDRSLYLGILESMWTVSGGLEPVLGGIFSEYASWRWNF